jgi:hypothetical protein
MSEPRQLPAETTVYDCPLSTCYWAYAELPMTAGELAASLAEPVLDVAMRRALAVENELTAHLAGHALLEWVQEIGRLRDKMAALERKAA